jgi:hypothetical protein
MPKLDFEGYRNDIKKSYEEEQYPSAMCCGLQRKKGNILVRFEPTNLRIVFLKNYLR